MCQGFSARLHSNTNRNTEPVLARLLVQQLSDNSTTHVDPRWHKSLAWHLGSVHLKINSVCSSCCCVVIFYTATPSDVLMFWSSKKDVTKQGRGTKVFSVSDEHSFWLQIKNTTKLFFLFHSSVIQYASLALSQHAVPNTGALISRPNIENIHLESDVWLK